MTEIDLTERLLNAELNRRQLRPEYSDDAMKSVIHSAIKKSLAEKCTLRIDDDGQLTPMQRDDETCHLYKDNRRQSVDDLIVHFGKYFVSAEEAQRQEQRDTSDDLKDIAPNLRHMHYMHRNFEH